MVTQRLNIVLPFEGKRHSFIIHVPFVKEADDRFDPVTVKSFDDVRDVFSGFFIPHLNFGCGGGAAGLDSVCDFRDHRIVVSAFLIHLNSIQKRFSDIRNCDTLNRVRCVSCAFGEFVNLSRHDFFFQRNRIFQHGGFDCEKDIGSQLFVVFKTAHEGVQRLLHEIHVIRNGLSVDVIDSCFPINPEKRSGTAFDPGKFDDGVFNDDRHDFRLFVFRFPETGRPELLILFHVPHETFRYTSPEFEDPQIFFPFVDQESSGRFA